MAIACKRLHVQDRWATGVKEMRDIFVRLESEGYSRESQQVWGPCARVSLVQRAL